MSKVTINAQMQSTGGAKVTITAEHILDLFFPRREKYWAGDTDVRRMPNEAGKELLSLIKEELDPYYGDED